MGVQFVGGSSAAIELRGVSKHYREGDRTRAVLDGVDATIGRGEFVALLGPSGSGKSTLLNLISGIDLPTAGDVVVDGIDLTRLGERDRTLFRRRHIGFVFQFFNLLPTLTVEENLLLPLELNGEIGRRERERVASLLDKIGLGDRAKSFPDRLSGGEQQRIAVVRALIHEPSLVLADEPTGNLDQKTGHQVLQLIDELVRSAGKTLVAVTHSEALAEGADRVLMLQGGRLVERSAPGPR